MSGEKDVAVAVTTRERIGRPNEDAFAYLDASGCARWGCVIADGVGSAARAGEAARAAVEVIRAEWTENDVERPAALRAAFGAAQRALSLLDDSESQAGGGRRLQTTALAIGLTEEAIQVGFTGNGSILLVAGDCWQKPPELAASWVTELVLPQVIAFGGGSEYPLAQVLAPDRSAEPRLLRIERDQRFGDLLIAGSDGWWSAEQTEVGRDGSQRFWRRSLAEEWLTEALRSVNPYSEPDALEGTATRLAEALIDCRVRHGLDDDVTIGVVITAAFHRSWIAALAGGPWNATPPRQEAAQATSNPGEGL